MRMGKVERKIAVLESNKMQFKSRFNFITEHNGFRKSKIHVLIADTGAGKSTLVRSLLLDIIKSLPKEKNILLVLSEESISDYEIQMEISGLDDAFFSRIEIISQLDFKKNENIKMMMQKELLNPKIGFVIFDNITTCDEYQDKAPAVQFEFAKWLKTLAMNTSLPFLIMAHANNILKSSKSLIAINQIRGNKGITMVAEFIYILNSFFIRDEQIKIVELSKSRNQDVNRRIFCLQFDKSKRIYSGDKFMNFETMSKILKERNVY